MKINFAEPLQPGEGRAKGNRSGALAVTVSEDKTFGPAAQLLDQETNGALSRAISSSRFTGKKDQILQLLAPPMSAPPIAGSPETVSAATPAIGPTRIVLAGIGKLAEIDAKALENFGGTLYAQLAGSGEMELAIDVSGIGEIGLAAADAAAAVALGAALRSYRFDKYRTRERPDQKPSLKRLTILTRGATAARKAYAERESLADAISFARDLVSEPGNVLYPESFADRCAGLEKHGLEVEIIDEKRIKKLGMGAIIAVAQGSVREARLVVMRWNGAADKNAPPIAFVGKGITFDTGGISIKAAGGMEDMKFDMAGAATVAGLMRRLATRKAKVNAIGIVALAENMPDGNATRPGDIVTSLSGQTIEIINTDAEGRLVLADALWYVQDQYKPRFMIDLATLTGAILVALGDECAGLFSNNDELAERLQKASKTVGEPIWRLPLQEGLDRSIDSDAADMKNVASGRGAGSIIAALFLKRFVNDVPWAHLDIAGAAWTRRDMPTTPKGATGFGIRLLDQLVVDYCES